ncbi:glycine--tRNA ligase, partial [uncultured Corynebacterium sp.]
RYRADHLLEAYEEKHGHPPANGLADINDPETGQPGKWTEPRAFSGLMKTYLGPVDDKEGLAYLRPETAQGIFTQFKNVMNSSRQKPPFGIAQIGKSFRNEITPGNFIFRTREFEQMEMEFFVEPGTDEEWQEYWIEQRLNWYVNLGIDRENLRLREHTEDELSHYAKRTVDVEYAFHFTGSKWGELEGVANRTDYDLKTHSEGSGEDLSYYDQQKEERWIPYVIEPAAGLGRSLMAFLVDAYTEEEVPNAKGGTDTRTVLKLDPRLSPVKVAVLPLSKKETLTPTAEKIADKLRGLWNIDYDTSGAIGRRYRRQDEIGTPYCVTVDFDTLEDNAVTVRERDTMEQERVAIDELEGYLAQRLAGC